MSKIILFTGKIGSGKTTASAILKKYGFIQYNFADALKQFALSIGFTKEQLYGTQQQKLEINDFWKISAREFLQKFGTDVCRDSLPKLIPNMDMNNRSLWCRIIEQHLDQPNELIVIGDGRFPDEIQLIKDHNGVIIELIRNSTDSTDYINHISETALDGFDADYKIENNGTKHDLEDNILAILDIEKIRYKI